MRSTLKHLAESVATGSGLAAAARRAHRDGIAVLAYHNVVHPEESGLGDGSLHLPLPRFIEQVERLSQTHDIVDLRALPPAGNRPRAVITFDDAYRGAVTLALPELVRRGIPATVFVAPALLGTPHTWWDALAAAGRLDEATRTRALEEHGGRTGSILEVFLGGAPRVLPPSYGIATEAELRAHLGTGISIGSHTWAHEYVPALSAAERAETLTRSLAWVHSFAAAASCWLALPYGGGSAAIGREALALGYCGVLRIEGGLWLGKAESCWVPRLNVPAGLSRRGMELRSSGL